LKKLRDNLLWFQLLEKIFPVLCWFKIAKQANSKE
jgi:hypothetical protein